MGEIVNFRVKLLSSSIAVLSAVSGLSTSGCKDGVYPHEYKCDSYYQCANGHRYEDQKCPDNLLFNPKTLKCDYPSAVDCPTVSYKKCFYKCRKNGGRVFSCKKECAQYISKPEKPTNAPTTTTQKPTEKPKKCKDGIYLEPGTCDKYYQCENGVKYPPQDCPPGLDFNEAAGYCDWPQNVECSVKPTPTPTEPAPEKPEFNGCFLSCRKSGKSKIKCLKECFGNEKPSKECPQGDGIFGDSEKCNEFYMCHNGHRFENQECPEPLLFSEETNQCEHPAEVECANKPKYCEDGIYPVPGICNAFYQCSNGIWWDKQYCPDGLLFNPEVDVCDWPENVECDGQKEDGCYISCRKSGQSKLVCAKKCLFSGNDGGNKPKVCPEDGIFRDPETVQNSTTVQTVLSLRANSALQVFYFLRSPSVVDIPLMSNAMISQNTVKMVSTLYLGYAMLFTSAQTESGGISNIALTVFFLTQKSKFVTGLKMSNAKNLIRIQPSAILLVEKLAEKFSNVEKNVRSLLVNLSQKTAPTVSTQFPINATFFTSALTDIDMKTSTVRSLSFSHLSLISVNTHVTSFLNVTIAVTSNIVKTGSARSLDATDFSLVQTVFNGKPSTARVTFFLTKMKAFVIGQKMSMKTVMVLPQSQQVPQHLSPASLIVLFDA